MLLLTSNAKRHKENERDVLYKLMYSNSQKVSCSFLVHLSNSQVCAVNNIFKIIYLKLFTFLEKWGANEGAKKMSGGS